MDDTQMFQTKNTEKPLNEGRRKSEEAGNSSTVRIDADLSAKSPYEIGVGEIGERGQA